MIRIRALFLVIAIAMASPALAQDTLPPAPYAYRQLNDANAEAKAKALMETLRCIQCQGQAISDSDAPIAGAMRSLVREKIAEGEKPEDIRAWLIERYGDYVSYKPRVTATTWPLYATPLALIAIAILVLSRRLGRRRDQ